MLSFVFRTPKVVDNHLYRDTCRRTSQLGIQAHIMIDPQWRHAGLPRSTPPVCVKLVGWSIIGEYPR